MTVFAQVIEVDARPRVSHGRVATQAREAAARYGDHGADLLGRAQTYGSIAQAARPDPADGWTLVGRWLTYVAVLSALALAFALFGNLTAR